MFISVILISAVTHTQYSWKTYEHRTGNVYLKYLILKPVYYILSA